MKKILWSYGLCAVLAACGKAPEPTHESPRVENETVTFPADSVQLKGLASVVANTANEEIIKLSGRVLWDETRTVRVFAPLGGRVVTLDAKPGDKVKAGAILATLTSPDFGIAQTEAAKAAAAYSVAEKAIARARELNRAGILADKDMQQAEADYVGAAAERNRTAARARAYGDAGSGIDQKFALRAPIAGTVVERNVNPGQEVRADGASDTPLFVISDPSRLWVNLDLPEKTVDAVKPGVKVILHLPAFDNEERSTVIEHVADFVDSDTRRIRARALVDNTDHRLKADMFINAEIMVPRPEFLNVPANAVILLGKTQYVFIEEAVGRYRRQAVVADDAGFGNMHVRNGLKSGDRIVSEGALLLQQIMSSAVGQ